MKARSTAESEHSHRHGGSNRGGHGQGQQAMAVRDRRPEMDQQQGLLSLLAGSPRLQRKCACGAPSSAGGSCAACEAKAIDTSSQVLQKQLAIGATDDLLEREADRVADQVMAAPTRFAVSSAPPRIQRLTGQGGGQMDTAPASVERVIVGSGRPLEPALRRDMESHFGQDFSRVRVHSSAVAGQSAQALNAHAYTVGHHIVFGAGRFAPGTSEGRRLLAHELTHVVQQSTIEGITPGQRNEIRGPHQVSQKVERLFANRVAQGAYGLPVQRKPGDETTVPIAPKPTPPKPSPQKGLNRTLHVIDNDIWNRLPRTVRFSAEQELKNLFAFVGASSSEKPFSIKVVTASQLPEQFDFSESVVTVIRGDTQTYVKNAFARQEEQIKHWLAGQKVQVLAKTSGGKTPFMQERIGTGGGNRSLISDQGKTYALLVMAGAVDIDEVIESFFDNIDSLLENKLKVLPKKGRDPTEWPSTVLSNDKKTSWEPLEMLGVALARAIAHEARHEYVGAGHSETGLREEAPFIIGEKNTAQFSTADQKAILDQIHNLEATQGKATAVPTFPQSMRKKPEQFPY